ncbi:MAG: heterodisulfide reductase [Sulfurospirillaceae bacterium]|nr:heterodisulfide reductase [Sulfurospirillaceae bacterium]
MKKYVLFDSIIDINTTEPIARSTQELLKFLNVKLVNIKNFSRDTGIEDMGFDMKNFYINNAKNLALANKEQCSIICADDSSYLSLCVCVEELKNNEELKNEINSLLREEKLELDLDIEIYTLADFLVKELGNKKISKHIKHKFEQFNAAMYLGSHKCLISKYTDLDSYSEILNILGINVINYDLKDQSSGYEILDINPNLAFKMSGALMLDMFDNAADFVVVNDARSFVMFDKHQKELEKSVGREIGLSVFGLAQILLLGFGETNKDVLGLNDHKVKTKII